MYFLIYHLSIHNLERVEVNALAEGEDGITYGGVVGQPQILL
jgi:hypothetical protein